MPWAWALPDSGSNRRSTAFRRVGSPWLALASLVLAFCLTIAFGLQILHRPTTPTEQAQPRDQSTAAPALPENSPVSKQWTVKFNYVAEPWREKAEPDVQKKLTDYTLDVLRDSTIVTSISIAGETSQFLPQADWKPGDLLCFSSLSQSNLETKDKLTMKDVKDQPFYHAETGSGKFDCAKPDVEKQTLALRFKMSP
jgi:hypothetical protein